MMSLAWVLSQVAVLNPSIRFRLRVPSILSKSEGMSIIRSLRRARGLSVDALARKTNLSRSTVQRLDRGESGHVSSFAAIAEALGVSLSQVYPVLGHGDKSGVAENGDFVRAMPDLLYIDADERSQLLREIHEARRALDVLEASLEAR